jgi:hypothetical protein
VSKLVSTTPTRGAIHETDYNDRVGSGQSRLSGAWAWWVKFGPISKRGNGYLRRFLVKGAVSVLCRRRAKEDPWLVKLRVPASRLKREERALRECITAFRASDRLSRDDLHRRGE